MLAQVAAVHADVTLPTEPKAVDEMVRPARRERGRASRSPGLAVSPNLVRVQMHFVAGPGRQVSRLFGTDGVRGVANAISRRSWHFGSAAPRRACWRNPRSAPPGHRRARYAALGDDARGGDRRRHHLGRARHRLLGIVPTPAVACVTTTHRGRGGRHDQRVAQSDRRQRHQVLWLRRLQALRRARKTRSKRCSTRRSSAPDRNATSACARVAQNLGAPLLRGALRRRRRSRRPRTSIVDGAFGAAYAIAPYALRKLGATRHRSSTAKTTARESTSACGATDLRPLQAAVRAKIAGASSASSASPSTATPTGRCSSTKPASVVSGDHVMFAMARDHARTRRAARRRDRRDGDEQHRLRTRARSAMESR